MKKLVLAALAVCHIGLLAVLFHCAGGTEAGNPTTAGGTETGNPKLAKVLGICVDTAGAPQGNVRVRLLPSAYDPETQSVAPDSMADTTDAQGAYEVIVRTVGSYTLTGVHLTHATSLIISGIYVPDSALKDSAQIDLGPDTLKLPGSVMAEVPAASFKPGGYLYIPGTDISAPVLSAGPVMLDPVPAGQVNLLYYDPGVQSSVVLGMQYLNVEVLPADTTVIGDTSAAQEVIHISGGGRSIDYTNLEFVTLDFFGIPFTTILGYSGLDTLAMVLYVIPQLDTPVSFNDTASFIIAASLDSLQYAFYNVEVDSLNPTGFIQGSVTFTAFDTGQVITGFFADSSKLLGVDMADTSKFQSDISGSFRATRIP